MNGFPSPLDTAFTRTRWVDDRGAGGGGSSSSSGSNRFYLPSPAPFYQRTFSSGTAMGSPGAAASSVPALLPPPTNQQNAGKKLLTLSTAPTPDIDVSAVVPPVTVVIEGRSICQRVHLHKHTGYDGLAAALRHMFVDAEDDGGEGSTANGGTLDLSNAVPGYLVAYEDMEDDLLLAGDLNWKDFVRVAKRIRLLPAKSNRRRPAQQQQQPPPQPPRQSSQ